MQKNGLHFQRWSILQYSKISMCKLRTGIEIIQTYLMNCNFYRMLFRLTTLSKNQEEPGEEILGIHLHDPEMSYWMIKRKLNGAQLFTVILKTFIIASPSTTNKELVENLYQFVRIPENPNLSEVGVSFTYVQNRKERRGLNTFKVHKCPN